MTSPGFPARKIAVSVYAKFLKSIDKNHAKMVSRVTRFANINSGSTNLAGLARMLTLLKKEFHILGGKMETLDPGPVANINAKGELTPQKVGKILRITQRPRAKHQVLLVGHYDTVYGANHKFQKVKRIDKNTLNGPGVSDLKGGLVVMLEALKALEKSPWAKDVGWQVILNPDEEIGSFGSAKYLTAGAQKADLGLVFEPSLPDGTLAGKRKGNGNYTAVFHGVPAHVGREHHKGRSAILALARFTTAVEALNQKLKTAIFNVGHIEGGGPTNVVPDLAIAHFNVRAENPNDIPVIEKHLHDLIAVANQTDGIRATLHGFFNRMPKDLTPSMQKLFDALNDCARAEGFTLAMVPTGGCCDGNNLAAAGLPNLDSLGVRGGGIHSDSEYILLDSLVERARLIALFLMRLGAGDLVL